MVHAKTAKGVNEVALRTGGLSLSMRRVLIMVDGKRTRDELAPLVRAGDIDAVLAALESQGYIESVREAGFSRSGIRTDLGAAGTPVPLDVPTVDSEPNGERHLLTLEEAKRRAVRQLNDRLGPEAEAMAIRIEACRTGDELRERLREAERLVAGFLGDDAAQEFVRAMRRR